MNNNLENEKKESLKGKLKLYFLKRYNEIFGLLSAILTITATVFLVSETFTISEKSNLIETSKLKYYSSADNYLKNRANEVIDVQPLKTIFNSIDRESKGELYKYGFTNVLEDYYTYKINSNLDSTDKSQILSFIKNEIDQEPFRQLRPEQQRILSTINKAIELNDSIIAIDNLNKLNDIMRLDNQKMQSLEKENKISIPLAIIGIAFTIILGLLPFFRKK